MRKFNSIDSIFDTLFSKYKESQNGVFVILIGGCSRAGKSTLSHSLANLFNENHIECQIFNLDSWIISVDKRNSNSTVLERYETLEIRKALQKILRKELVVPPFYNPVSRKREEVKFGESLQLDTGVLIVEGVISLANHFILNISDAKIYVSVSDSIRIKRLIKFYRDVKKVTKDIYKKIIIDREKEETLFIKNTIKNADMIFNWEHVNSKEF